VYLATRAKKEPLADDMDKGMPSEIANEVASEKLSTVVIDITADARQRLSAFSTEERELMLCEGVCGTRRVIDGRSENIMKAKGEAT
jgi:hypothetical protein